MKNFLRRLFGKPNITQKLKENPPEAVEKLPSGAESMSRVSEISRQSEDFNYCETATNECRKTETPPKRELPLTRKYVKTEIDKFLDVKQKTRIIIFDIETNGFYASCSVLSCSAIKYEIDRDTHEMTEIDRFNRYYYPFEQFNPQAIDVNGLTRDVIVKKRGDDTYPEHFRMDSAFETFCSDTKKFIAHNISFDAQFIPFMGERKKFCTMMTNMNIVCASFLKWKNEWKWPSLSETAIHYGIQFSERDLHSSIIDAEITAKIFMKMLKAATTDGNGDAIEVDVSHHNHDPFHDFTWQLKNVNVNLVAQCKVGDDLNLIRERKINAFNYLGVATKSGEPLGDIESSDIKYYGLMHSIDHGAKTSVKIKQIFTMNGNFECINVKVFIGDVDIWKNKIH